MDTFQPYSKVVAATPGTDFMTALLAAPEIALAERGAFTIYGRCIKDVGDSVVFSLTYIRTSVNGSVLDSDHINYSGNPFLDIATPEGFRSLSSSSVQFPDSADYTAGHAASQPNTDWQAMAPGGSAVMGSAGNGAKQGNLPGGNGPYGAGDACLFSGFLAG